MSAVYRLPKDLTIAGASFFGYGKYLQSLTGLNPFGSNAGQRLRPDGSVIPVRDLKGSALSKLDVRVSKSVRLAGSVRGAGTAQAVDLLNHANYSGRHLYQASVCYSVP